MKMLNEMSLKAIRRNLEKVGVEMDDVQFNSLTYSDLRKVCRKSKKAYELYKQVDTIICKRSVSTPAVPMVDNDKDAKGF